MKPNLFIVGAAKAGTTSLFNYLKNHKDIYSCPIKEPNYFNTELKLDNCRQEIQNKIHLNKNYFTSSKLKIKHSACIDNLEEYLKLFEAADSKKIIIESSTSYLPSSNAAKEIYNFNSESKIIIILRDPVSRKISHYNMDLSAGKNSGNMLIDLKNDYNLKKKGYFISHMYLDLSLYYAQVQRYLNVFPKEQILILRYEDLLNDRDNFLKKTCKFIEIDYDKLQLTDVKVFNKTKIPRNNIMKFFLNFKSVLPSFIKSRMMFLKNIFLKNYEKDNIPQITLDYIKNIVDDDFKKTNILLKKLYNENV